MVKISLEFARASRNVLDLIQEGNVGLMEAVKNFDPYRGIRFPSYAVWWVRAYIYRFLINNWRLVKIGTTQAQRKLFFNLRKESERLEAEGFTAQPKLLAQRIGVKESEVREMQERMAQSEVSLDQPTGGSEDARLLDVIPDGARNPRRKRRNTSGATLRASGSRSSRPPCTTRSWRFSAAAYSPKIRTRCRISERGSASAASACARSRRGSSAG